MAIGQTKTNFSLPSLQQIERTVELLDRGVRMPIVPIRFPLDPIVGIIPVVGDVITLALSGTIISHARNLGAPSSLQRRMVANVIADCALGCIPFLGDAFDFFLKANQRNLRLLKTHLASKAQ